MKLFCSVQYETHGNFTLAAYSCLQYLFDLSQVYPTFNIRLTNPKPSTFIDISCNRSLGDTFVLKCQAMAERFAVDQRMAFLLSQHPKVGPPCGAHILGNNYFLIKRIFSFLPTPYSPCSTVSLEENAFTKFELLRVLRFNSRSIRQLVGRP